MSNPLQKSLNGYLSKIKRETEKLQLSSKPFSFSKKWIGFFQGVSIPGRSPYRSRPESAVPGRSPYPSRLEGAVSRTRTKATTMSMTTRVVAPPTSTVFSRKISGNFTLEIDGEDEDECERDHDRMRQKKGKGSRQVKTKIVMKPKTKTAVAMMKTTTVTNLRGHGERLFMTRPKSHTMCRRQDYPDEDRPSMASTSTTDGMQSRSNSSTHRSGPNAQMLPENCIAVLKYTPESMQEMMESKLGSRESKRQKISQVHTKRIRGPHRCSSERNMRHA